MKGGQRDTEEDGRVRRIEMGGRRGRTDARRIACDLKSSSSNDFSNWSITAAILFMSIEASTLSMLCVTKGTVSSRPRGRHARKLPRSITGARIW
eukprot:5514976-Pleurochrysis_carterae.AAC.2